MILSGTMSSFREGWIDEGITSYLASDELLYQDLESYKTEKQYGADGSREVYTNARNEVRSKSEADFLKGLDHCYLNEPWDVVPEGSNAGSKTHFPPSRQRDYGRGSFLRISE